MRRVVDDCTDCDCCRYIMDTNCFFFPKVYELWDREQETGEQITTRELRNLSDLCNYCALCPCPNIRDDIITAKTLFIDRDGLEPYIRTLEDVERLGKLCDAVPRLSNFLLQNRQTGRILKKITGISPKRKLPVFPRENFPLQARRQKLHEKSPEKGSRKIAYFAGCTARRLFPEVATAVIDVLKQNNVAVYYPEQNCCGMPSMLEGDRKLTLAFAGHTVSHLAEAVADGYDVVCSCPTCGYMLKTILRECAYYSKEYQKIVGGDDRHMKIPEAPPSEKVKHAPGTHAEEAPFRILDKSIYGRILKDDGYFSGIDPLKRISVAEHTYDLGEYLLALHRSGGLDTRLGPVPGRAVYYPPCHQREQGIGTPYLDLLALVPGMEIESFQSTFYCCGMAGIMGFKRDFHNASLQMGSRLMAKINRMAPDHLVTECLSCRLQFNQMIAHPVRHPIEILGRSYKNHHEKMGNRTESPNEKNDKHSKHPRWCSNETRH